MVFYSPKKGAKVIRVRGMDKFLSVVDDGDVIIRVISAVPALGDVPISGYALIQAIVSAQTDIPAPTDVPTQADVHHLMLHLDLLHAIKEMCLLGEIMRLCPDAPDWRVLVVLLAQ